MNTETRQKRQQVERLHAEAEAWAKADRAANDGKPVTRIIDGELHYKLYGFSLPEDDEPAFLAASWAPESVYLDRDNLPPINAN